MEYKRLTFRYESVDGTKEVGYTEKLIPCFNKQAMILNRLAELEDKIEQGTLKEIPENAVVLTGEELETIRDRIAEIKKKIRKEMAEKSIKILKDMRQRLVRCQWSEGWHMAIDVAIDEICKEFTEGKV